MDIFTQPYPLPSRNEAFLFHMSSPDHGPTPMTKKSSCEDRLRFCIPLFASFCQVAEETAVKIDAAREGYRSAAIRASVAYFVLDDLARVDPMYQVLM